MQNILILKYCIENLDITKAESKCSAFDDNKIYEVP